MDTNPTNDVQETVDEFLTRGGTITICKPLDNQAVIQSLKPKYKILIDGVEKHAGHGKKEAPF